LRPCSERLRLLPRSFQARKSHPFRCGVAASGVSGLAAYLAHGNDAVAAGQAAIAAAAAKAIQTLPSDHPALPVVKAIVAATADSNPAV